MFEKKYPCARENSPEYLLQSQAVQATDQETLHNNFRKRKFHILNEER